MLLKTRDKWDAAYDILNVLLHDKEKYCNMCGAKWRGKPCCDHPQIGDNFTHLKNVVAQNKSRKSLNISATGESKKGHMRTAMAMPPCLFNDWCMIFEHLYKEKLFKTPKDLHTCMKRMPFLATCDII